MKVRELPGWPPKWEPYDIGDVAIGEMGILKGVSSTFVRGELHIVMEHEDSLYNGRLMLDEEIVTSALSTLTPETNKPISEIAGMELKTARTRVPSKQH